MFCCLEAALRSESSRAVSGLLNRQEQARMSAQTAATLSQGTAGPFHTSPRCQPRCRGVAGVPALCPCSCRGWSLGCVQHSSAAALLGKPEATIAADNHLRGTWAQLLLQDPLPWRQQCTAPVPCSRPDFHADVGFLYTAGMGQLRDEALFGQVSIVPLFLVGVMLRWDSVCCPSSHSRLAV